MKTLKFELWVIFLSVFVAGNVSAQFENFENHTIDYYRPTFETAAYYDSTKLDSLIAAQMQQNHIPGLASCIVRNNRIIWNRCYGYANIEKDLLVNDSTAFLLASVTKTFTGTAVMQLWEQRLFSLDHNINTYLPPGISVINPYYPEDPISFRMLLTHTSSIKYNYYNSDRSLIIWGGDSPVSLDSFAVNYFSPAGIYYDSTNYNNTSAPGTIYEYSNEAVTLLGYLTGIIADTSFYQYCNDHIFNPLGMDHTAWFLNDLDTNNLAMPYYYLSGTYYPIGYYSYPGYPSGLLKSCSADLARFLMAYINKGELNGVRILNGSTVTAMNTELSPQIAPGQGAIWRLDYRGGSKVWYHGGKHYGTSTRISYNPDKKFGVIILSNMDTSPNILDEIYDALYQYGLEYVTGIEIAQAQKPESFHLSQNYPNPFNPVTTISYQLPAASMIDLSIYNILGQKVATLVSGKQPAGVYKVEWDATGLASGVYFYRLSTDNGFMQTRKLILHR